MENAIAYPASFCRTVTDNLDIAVYVADLNTSEVLFLNGYARKRWGVDYRQIRCGGERLSLLQLREAA